MSIAVSTYPFRFDSVEHEYVDLTTGRVLPHITGMLKAAGLVDDTWFTEESSLRGQMVHRLTADYDLGALHVESCDSGYRGYLLAHVKALSILQPDILAVEEPLVHPPPTCFGGRPDRVIRLRGQVGVLELKAAQETREHAIQTALQAILVAAAGELQLPPELFGRWGLYLKKDGKFKLKEHTDTRRDFAEARRIIARYAV